ncbi:Y-family DNA polymerase [Weissella viridescens]|uniref:Y-family DNA polymerase n=1 Tax=Weissella viridescens TaxID=1629 RepID=UPI003AF2FB13
MLPTQDEPRRQVMMIDSKSFYASCESIARGLNPLQAMLVVISQAENTNGGLVLASSPKAKQELGITNVMRKRDIPKDDRLIMVEPRMNYYIAMNKKVNDIFREFVAEEDLQLYSIDESLLDVTSSFEYLKSIYGHDLTMPKLARIIQLEVKQKLGLYLTVGIGDNPTMAKLALDLEAKHNHSLIGEWHYETVPQKLWPINELSKVWSIGKRTAKTLNRMGIVTMGDLARANPYQLQEKLGVRGSDLFALAWGVDRSIVSEHYRPQETNISNSQVLPRDYGNELEIKNVIREIGEQVASRLRKQHKATQVVSLSVGAALTEENKGFSAQVKIEPTNQSKLIVQALWSLFDQHYEGQMIRHIGVSVGKLSEDVGSQLDLFVPADQDAKQQTIDATIDDIRKKYGLDAIVKSSSKIAGGTMLDRVGLVGGHNGGNAYG